MNSDGFPAPDKSAPTTNIALRLAGLRVLRTVGGGLLAVALAAMANFITSQTPVTGESIPLDGESLILIVTLGVLGAGINGVSKFLREKGIVTNPPV